MTDPNLAVWLLEGGLPRIAENLARVITRVEVLERCPECGESAGCAENCVRRADEPADACEPGICPGCHKPYESPDHDPRCSSCSESDTGPEPEAPSSDTPCSCDESVRLRALVADREDQLVMADRTVIRLVAAKDDFEKRGAAAEAEAIGLGAEVAELSRSVAGMVLQRDELRAEVERLKAVADAARVYRKLLGSTDGMWIHEEHRALAVAVDEFEMSL